MPKKMYKKRKPTNVKRYKPKRIRSLHPVHYFKRTINSVLDTANCDVDGTYCYKDTSNSMFQLLNPVGSTAGTKLYGLFVYQFSIENLPNVSEFAALFDFYRINKVAIKLTPRATIVDSSSNATYYTEGMSPNFHYVYDNDDVSGVTGNESGINVLRQYENYKSKRVVGSKPLRFVVRPSLNMTGYGYPTAVSVNPKKMGAWLNCAIINVKHFGLKGIFEYLVPTASTSWKFSFEVEATYYMSFKGVR